MRINHVNKASKAVLREPEDYELNSDELVEFGGKKLIPRFHCSCGHDIMPGEPYKWIQFRYGGKRVKCAEHNFRPSEMTQSKMSMVYAAQEQVEDMLAEVGATVDDIRGAVEEAADQIGEVADEYRDAAEAMGGAGYESEEKADALEEYADELRNIDFPDEADAEFDEEAVRAEIIEEKGGDEEALDQNWLEGQIEDKRQEWEEEFGDVLETLRSEVEGVLGNLSI